MKCVSTIPLINNNVTADLTDSSQGIVKINIDDEWTYSAITSIKLEVYANVAVVQPLNGNYVDIEVYDKTNSATAGTMRINAPCSSCVTQSSDFKSYFNGKGEIEIHLKVDYHFASGNIYCARLVVEMDGAVEKFVEYQTCGVKWGMGIGAPTPQLTPVLNLYTSGNWDGTVATSWCATLWTNASGGTSYGYLYDGASTQGDISSTSTTPEYKSASTALTTTNEYQTYQKVSGFLKTAYCALPLMIFKISGDFSKFELQNVLNNYHENGTSTPWTEGNHRWLFDPAQWDDCTRTHYGETCARVTVASGTSAETRLTDDGTGVSDALDFIGTTTIDRLRSSSFTEPASSSEVGWESDDQSDGYTITSNNRHLILITNAVNAAGTNFQVNIGDSWHAVEGMQINIGDTWKAVSGMQINIGDTWKTIF